MSTQLGSMSVGSAVKLNLGGSPRDFLVVHQGLPSSMYDSSCNGTWLLLKDIYTTRTWDSSNNDYKNSDIHSYLNGTFLNLFDDDIKNAIKQVKIPYQNGTGSGGSVASGANGLSCKIFLLSGYELGWTTKDSPYLPRDGAKLSYFSSGTGSDANNKRIANYNGSATRWWLRSPGTDGTGNVRNVNTGGLCNNRDCSRSLWGFGPLWFLTLHSRSLTMGLSRRTSPRLRRLPSPSLRISPVVPPSRFLGARAPTPMETSKGTL